MQRIALFIGALIVTFAAALAILAAVLINEFIETSTQKKVSEILADKGFGWVSLRTDGLNVHLSGPAPNEGNRFTALAVVQEIVSGNRIHDTIKVVDPDDLHVPRFSLELLRNGGGISLIGLIPEKTGRDNVLKAIEDVANDSTVTDMLETSDFPLPEGWKDALNYALKSLRLLPRSKISVTPMEVTITAITDSAEEKLKIETDLENLRPEGLKVNFNISAPRPVVTPFSLRLIIDDMGTRFDSCSADNEDALQKILRAAKSAGLTTEADCTIGLGVPSPRWGEAAETSIIALSKLGGGSLTFSGADITLVSSDQTSQLDFDRIVHNLEQELPDVFSVQAVLPPKPAFEGEEATIDIPEFTATKSPEGLVQMHGRIRDSRSKSAIHNFALAHFGGENVHDTTRLDPTLPDGWPLKILAGIQSLAKLRNGILVVHPDMIELRGTSDREEAKTEVTQILSDKLQGTTQFTIDINYEAALNKILNLPTAQECVDRINTILEEKKIVFKPSSSKINTKTFDVVEKIAEAMADCSEVPMEIGGHTDSQGRETMNQTLSRSRAEAVLDALLSLDVLTTFLSAKGYGESFPIADNGTTEGRALNRRIEFTLLEDEDTLEADTESESAGEDGGTKEKAGE